MHPGSLRSTEVWDNPAFVTTKVWGPALLDCYQTDVSLSCLLYPIFNHLRHIAARGSSLYYPPGFRMEPLETTGDKEQQGYLGQNSPTTDQDILSSCIYEERDTEQLERASPTTDQYESDGALYSWSAWFYWQSH